MGAPVFISLEGGGCGFGCLQYTLHPRLIHSKYYQPKSDNHYNSLHTQESCLLKVVLKAVLLVVRYASTHSSHCCLSCAAEPSLCRAPS